MTVEKFVMGNFEILIVLTTAIWVLITNTPFNSLKWWWSSLLICLAAMALITWN